MTSKVSIFNYGDQYIYVPISNPIKRKKSTLAQANDHLLRAFLPSTDKAKIFAHSFTDKRNKLHGNYFETVRAIQKSWNDKIDGLTNVHRGVIQEGILSPSFGFIKIKVQDLKEHKLSRICISTLLTSIDERPDGIYNFELEMAQLFDSRSTTGRKFQREFDENAKCYWGNKCAITGVSLPVQSCHIKSVNKCKSTLDIAGFIVKANSIRLQASLHLLFDNGYFSFLDDGSIVISDKFLIYDMKKYHIHPKIKINLPEGANKYLKEHRAEFFPHTTKLVA